MKMKATSTVEYEADDNDDRAHYFLEQALKRAQTALKDSIEQGARGAAAATGIRKNSTNIVVVNRLERFATRLTMAATGEMCSKPVEIGHLHPFMGHLDPAFYAVHEGAIYQARTSDAGVTYHAFPYRGTLSKQIEDHGAEQRLHRRL